MTFSSPSSQQPITYDLCAGKFAREASRKASSSSRGRAGAEPETEGGRAGAEWAEPELAPWALLRVQAGALCVSDPQTLGAEGVRILAPSRWSLQSLLSPTRWLMV